MNVIIVGHGRMGQLIEEEILKIPGAEVVGIVHPGIFESATDVPGPVDSIIDFSYPGNLDKTIERALSSKAALVLGTTGYSDEQVHKIYNASKSIPIVFSSNYSLGVAVLRRAVKLAAPMLDGFDIEIVETHHNKKVDAPSGTAKMLLDAVDPNGSHEKIYGRHGIIGARGNEIGVHALRGGTVAGEHSVFFFGNDELLEFRHSAASRRIFASGAVRALKFALGKPAGLYTIDDVIA